MRYDKEIFRSKRGLIVDDEPLLREMLLLDFEELGCEMSEAPGGLRAIELLQEKSFDFIISDVRMPDGTGHDILNFIRENNLQTKIILVSGFCDLTSAKVLEMGGHGLVDKPFDRQDLFTTVANLL